MNERDTDYPLPSARVDGIEGNARWNRDEYDAFPILQRLGELRKIIARYDIFAAIWKDHLQSNGYGILFLKGEEHAGSPREVSGGLRPGFLMCDNADHASGLRDALAFNL